MKTKILLLVVLSIIIGFLLGFFTSGIVLKKRVEYLKEERKPGNLEDRILRTIKATSEQEKEIRPILEEFASNEEERRRTQRKKSKKRLNELIDLLEPHLENDQKKKLQRRINRLKRKKKRFRPDLAE